MPAKSSLKRQVYLAEFARPAAYGDIVTALLALATLPGRLGLVLTWAFSVWGSADPLFAFNQGNTSAIANAPGLMGATYFIPTVLVPLLLVTHVLVFRLLLKGESPPATRNNQSVAREQGRTAAKPGAAGERRCKRKSSLTLLLISRV